MNNENWDLIYSYTADQAVEDGVLVKPNPKAYPNHLVTNALHHAILEKVGEEGYERAIHVLFLDAALTIMPGDEEEHLWTDGLEGNVTGKTIWIARNELGGLTLMFPEDY
ncbi:MAG: hypothetical protein IH988_05290 [Planctomycetes bacterium]|nr:hypothetical protein [Planctomycetota bacterium]